MESVVARMLGNYESWPRQVEAGFESGIHASSELGGVPEIVEFCGMGTSGFSGEYAGFILDEAGWGRVWRVTRGPAPLWLGRGLTVAISYSGTTAETVSCARRALESGRVAAVTSGGDLASLAPVVARVAPGRPQRTSLAEMTAAAIGLLSPAARGVESYVGSIVDALSRPWRGTIGEAVDALAEADIAVVAGCGYMGLAAHRWRTELAENAKMLAKTEAYPESGHNDLVAYQSRLRPKTAFIILLDRGDRFCREVMEAVAGIYEEQGRLVIVEPEGDTRPAKLLRGAQLAGLASTLAAERRGVDPESTPILHRYREAVRRIGGL